MKVVMKEKLKNLKWWHWLLIALVALGLLGSVSPSSDSSIEVSSSNSEDSDSAESATKSPDCISLPASVLETIASGEEPGVGMKSIRGFAVKSADFNNVYFFAIEFSATGISSQTGVWARNGIDSGIIMSVDGFAKEFTVWPDASKTDANISTADRNVLIAKSCL